MGMIDFYMLKASFGFSAIISWEELLGENNELIPSLDSFISAIQGDG